MQIIDVRRIWDAAPHNAFTDLIRFDGKWFCAFREGETHVSPDGALRVIQSVNGEVWGSAALITSPNSDLRDPKLAIRPDGQLMLSCAEAMHDQTNFSHRSLMWHSMDGVVWKEKLHVGEPDFWLWRHVWHKGSAYAVGYHCQGGGYVKLYRCDDGKTYIPINERLFDIEYPSETALIFEDDTAYCLLRRDGKPGTGLLGTATSPFIEWQWMDCGVPIGGPQMTMLPDGRCVAAVRLYDGMIRTALCDLDLDSGRLTEQVTLPSGGDTSYAGMVVHADQLWVSYYSSHEDNTAIYLARLDWRE